jgi:hypothetical protein
MGRRLAHWRSFDAVCSTPKSAKPPSRLRAAHPDTKLSMREVHWGLIPDMTGTLMLSRLVRDNVMKDLVFTGRIPPARNLSSRLTQVGSM